MEEEEEDDQQGVIIVSKQPSIDWISSREQQEKKPGKQKKHYKKELKRQDTNSSFRNSTQRSIGKIYEDYQYHHHPKQQEFLSNSFKQSAQRPFSKKNSAKMSAYYSLSNQSSQIQFPVIKPLLSQPNQRPSTYQSKQRIVVKPSVNDLKHGSSNSMLSSSYNTPATAAAEASFSQRFLFKNVVKEFQGKINSTALRAACFAPVDEGSNHAKMLIGTKDKRILIFQAKVENSRVRNVNQIFQQKNHHDQAIFCADWSRSGRLIATGSLDKTIKLLVCPDFLNQDNFTKLLQLSLVGSSGAVRKVCFSPISDIHLFSCGSSSTIRVWNTQTGQKIDELIGHTNQVHTIEASPDGQTLFSAGSDRVVKLWDLRVSSFSTKKRDVATFTAQSSSRGNFRINDISIGRIRSDSIYDSVAAGFSDGAVCLWDVRVQKYLKLYINHFNEIRSLSFRGKYLSSGDFDGKTKILNTHTHKISKTIEQGKSKILVNSFHSDFPFLLNTFFDGSWRIWSFFQKDALDQ